MSPTFSDTAIAKASEQMLGLVGDDTIRRILRIALAVDADRLVSDGVAQRVAALTDAQIEAIWHAATSFDQFPDWYEARQKSVRAALLTALGGTT